VEDLKIFFNFPVKSFNNLSILYILKGKKKEAKGNKKAKKKTIKQKKINLKEKKTKKKTSEEKEKKI
jgi:hypothetical protein